MSIFIPNIGYKTAEIELSLNLLAVGDFKGISEDKPTEER